MKIYISHSREFDYINELYRPIRESSLNDKYNFFLPHENNVAVNSKTILQDSDLIIAEVSFPATGQGIELGWANSLNKPIICISKEGQKISNSLKYITDKFVVYTDKVDLIKKVSDVLIEYEKNETNIHNG